jgi:zinc transport system substrate-binding protein
MVPPLLLSLAAGNCGRPPVENPDGRFSVIASILPLADFAREIGGDRVRVEVLVQPGASPHTYELVPSQLQAASRARLLVLNDIGLEFWRDGLISAADNPRLTVVNASEGLSIIAGDDDEPGGNPHVWLSPRNAMHQVRMIRDALVKSDPDGSQIYQSNATKYLGQLDTLDHEIRKEVGTFAHRKFVAFHAAWAYFARDYGLEEADVIERRPGQEPSPEDIASIVQLVRSIHAQAIFAEPQFSPKAVEVIAEEAGAQVLFLNPLGLPPDYKYLDLMRYNLQEFAKALK